LRYIGRQFSGGHGGRSAKRFKEPTKLNCIDGTLLAIAAERAIKQGEVVTIEGGN
jgi:hypothetical protein